MVNFVRRIINFFKLGNTRKELKKLTKNYFCLVNLDWKKLGSSKRATLYPKSAFEMNAGHKVSVLKGIELVLASNHPDKIIYFDELPNDVKEAIKMYVRQRGYSDSFVKSSNRFIIIHLIGLCLLILITKSSHILLLLFRFPLRWNAL